LKGATCSNYSGRLVFEPIVSPRISLGDIYETTAVYLHSKFKKTTRQTLGGQHRIGNVLRPDIKSAVSTEFVPNQAQNREELTCNIGWVIGFLSLDTEFRAFGKVDVGRAGKSSPLSLTLSRLPDPA
jgi:hypothetical protein